MPILSRVARVVVIVAAGFLMMVSIGTHRAAAQDDKEQPKVQPSAERAKPTAEEMESWRRKILKVRTPKEEGCFTADYPDAGWREITCKTPPHKLYLPRRRGGVRTEQVGGTSRVDFVPVVTGDMTESEGSFDSVTGVSSECEVQCTGAGGSCPTNPSCSGEPSDIFSLQLNTNTAFNAQACNSSSLKGTNPITSCQAWEQFVYGQEGTCSGCLEGVFIQDWIINYGPLGTSCPSPTASAATCSANGGVVSGQWCSFQFASTDPVYCVINGPGAATPPTEAIGSLDQLKLTGDTAGGGMTKDSATFWEGGTPYKATGGNYFSDLGTWWKQSEFNVFGDGGGSEAVFNSGVTIHVRTGVLSGTTSGPDCADTSFTGESNNLTLGNTAPTPVKENMPALLFWESFPAPSGGSATCSDATSVGDTHMTTFDGLYYDFQSSGDYVLLEAPDFTVHARLASGAPTWPDASVNKGIATKMGKTVVEVYVQPNRLLIDGKARTLADGKSVLLSTGVQVTRHGSSYHITSESGNSVLASINSNPSMSWINTTVGLGRSPSTEAHGLLGNPTGDGHKLFTSKGVLLNEPVSFDDLYKIYGDSWRVPAGKSLFAAPTTIKPGNPVKPLFAKDLTPAQSAHALAVCKAAGISNQDLLDSCVLDTSVLNDDKAVKVFVHALPPRHVIKPIKVVAR